MSAEKPLSQRSKAEKETVSFLISEMNTQDLDEFLEREMRTKGKSVNEVAEAFITGDSTTDERICAALERKYPGFTRPSFEPPKALITESERALLSHVRHAFEQIPEAEREAFIASLLGRGKAASEIARQYELSKEECALYLPSLAVVEREEPVPEPAPPLPRAAAVRTSPPRTAPAIKAPVRERSELSLPPLSLAEYLAIKERLLAEGFTEKTIERGYLHRVRKDGK